MSLEREKGWLLLKDRGKSHVYAESVWARRSMLKVKTHAAIDAARTHPMDILHLCHGDDMGIRGLVSATKLRLGRDQD